MPFFMSVYLWKAEFVCSRLAIVTVIWCRVLAGLLSKNLPQAPTTCAWVKAGSDLSWACCPGTSSTRPTSSSTSGSTWCSSWGCRRCGSCSCFSPRPQPHQEGGGGVAVFLQISTWLFESDHSLSWFSFSLKWCKTKLDLRCEASTWMWSPGHLWSDARCKFSFS